jgi:hypothetical protein
MTPPIAIICLKSSDIGQVFSRNSLALTDGAAECDQLASWTLRAELEWYLEFPLETMIEVLVFCCSILNGDFIGSEAHIMLFLQVVTWLVQKCITVLALIDSSPAGWSIPRPGSYRY